MSVLEVAVLLNFFHFQSEFGRTRRLRQVCGVCGATWQSPDSMLGRAIYRSRISPACPEVQVAYLGQDVANEVAA